MSQRSNFEQRRSRHAYGVAIEPVAANLKRGRLVPVEQREIDFVLAKLETTPDLSAESLSRLVFNELGVKRPAATISGWIKRARAGDPPVARPPAASNRRSKRSIAEIRARKCSVEGCENPHRSSGLCGSHYNQKYRAENPPAPRKAARDGSGPTAQRRSHVPVTEAEVQFALECRRAMPTITAGEISRHLLRQFGTSRPSQTIRNWLAKAPTTTVTT